MRRRIVASTALIALAAVVVLGVPLALVEAARIRSDSAGRLEREADTAAGAIDDRLERRAPVDGALLARLIRPDHRIVVTTSDRRRIASRPPLPGRVLRAAAGSGLGAAVVAQAPAAARDARVRRSWLLIAALAVGGVLTAVALAALQARRLARPLEAIARRSEQLGDGDFSVRAGRFDVPEIDAIARGLDGSAERIAALVAREREFTANVSHQLRTPLTALRLRLEGADHDDRATAHAELLAAVGEADRLEATIADLLAHARRVRVGARVAMDLGAVADEHAARWRPLFARDGRTLDVDRAGTVVASVSRGTVGQVLDVLLENALRHGAGRVAVSVAGDDHAASVRVTDAGRGVAAADRERIFDRGASGAGGSGIGLHLARALVEADGGSLHAVVDEPACFELRLARLTDRSAPVAS